MRDPVPHIPSVGHLDFSGVMYVDRTTCFDHDWLSWTVETIPRFELLDFLEMDAPLYLGFPVTRKNDTKLFSTCSCGHRIISVHEAPSISSKASRRLVNGRGGFGSESRRGQ